ncbi:hypothetical protein ES703_24225 [subsurface metagenome]
MDSEQVPGLSEWLKGMCQREELSLRQAAEKTKLSHSTIESIRNGGSASAATVRKLAHGFSENSHERLALEDSLLILAGYRTPRGEELSQPLAQLMDVVAGFDESKLKLVMHFAQYLGTMEKER